MTAKEAANILKNMAFLDVERDHEKTEEAIKMAISALESIDRITAERDAAVKDLSGVWGKCFYCKNYDWHNCLSTPTRNGACWEWRGVQNET